MITFSFGFVFGGMVGTLLMCLFAAEAYNRGFKDGAKWDE